MSHGLCSSTERLLPALGSISTGQVIEGDNHEHSGRLDQRDYKNVFVSVAVREPGDSKQRNYRAIMWKGVHPAACHRCDTVQNLKRDMRGVGRCDKGIAHRCECDAHTA